MSRDIRLSRWIDRGLWALMTGAAVLATERMGSLSEALVDLRVTVSTFTERVETDHQELADHETRIRAIEASR